MALEMIIDPATGNVIEIGPEGSWTEKERRYFAIAPYEGADAAELEARIAASGSRGVTLPFQVVEVEPARVDGDGTQHPEKIVGVTLSNRKLDAATVAALPKGKQRDPRVKLDRVTLEAAAHVKVSETSVLYKRNGI